LAKLKERNCSYVLKYGLAVRDVRTFRLDWYPVEIGVSDDLVANVQQEFVQLRETRTER